MTVLICCNLQCNIQEISEEYKIVNAALKDYAATYKFKFIEESNNDDLAFCFKAYINTYKKFMETGNKRPAPMVKKGTEWILNQGDIDFILHEMNRDTFKIKWDRNKIKVRQAIYESEKRTVQISVSKPFLNMDKTKAVIFLDEVLPPYNGYGYLLLLKKVEGEWLPCGKIDYRVS
ncbi:hypothetical protein D2U88_04070 [Flagellimonas aequoris]|nr:hypothetical protein D2U88_04070 [Allomuricauda aequoris]